ncbi:hypothetical protein ACO1M6_13940, partial [Staphylococcus aureus]
VATGRSAVSNDVPMIDGFDHAIVHVPGPTPTWIDPTDQAAAPGMLSPSVEGHYALIAAKGVSGLVRTPESSPLDNTYTETREVFLPREGAAR